MRVRIQGTTEASDALKELTKTILHVDRCLKMAHDLRSRLVAEGRLEDAQVVDWMVATIRTVIPYQTDGL